MTVFRDKGPERDTTPAGRPDRTRWRRRRVLGTAAVIVLLLIMVFAWRSCHKAGSADAAAAEGANVTVSVQVAKAERAPIANEVTAVATLAARREATINPKIAAPIVQMALLTNRFVHQGDTIAVLEARDLVAQRTEAAAALDEAEASAHQTVNGAVPLTNAQDQKSLTDARAAVENARKTYERRQVLFDQGGISKKDLEASKLALTNAQDDLRLAETSSNLHRGITNPGDIAVARSKAGQARAHVATLDAQLSYSVIRAPFDGTVTGQFQYQGEMANPGAKLVTIADTASLIAKMQMSEAVASHLRVGDSVKVLPDEVGGQALSGSVDLVGRGVDPQSRAVDVWVSVANASGQLRPNGVARVVIASQLVSDAVVVPSSALTLDATNGSAGTLMVVDSKSVAHEVHVTIGVRSNGRVQILSGLKGGETVVTEGNYGLPDGSKVAIPQAGAAEPTAP
jgi:HlyD family secretion protein